MEENKNIEEGSKEEGLRLKEEEILSTPEIPGNPTPSTLNLTPLTPQPSAMEVHHHPDLHHKRKKFKEYFLEFLMIFLAVTLGFFAESYREHLVERKREKEYMKEIVQNLQYDSIRCSVNATGNYNILRGMDSLRNELKKTILGAANANAVYYFALEYTGNFSRAVFNTSAITELKSSGSLRLIENKTIVGEIADYYERKLTAAENYRPAATEISELQKTRDELLNYLELDDYINSFDSISDKTYSNGYDYRKLLEHTPPLQFNKNDPATLQKFYAEESLLEIHIKNYNFWLLYVKGAATKLIADIKKEYHLENE